MISSHGMLLTPRGNQRRSQVASVVGGAHIDVFSTGSVFTVDFNERYELWGDKSDWSQINTGTPTGDNFLWDAATSTMTVPSVNERTIIDILGSARSGMAVQIRQANTSLDPVGFRSGFYQITDIDVTLSPEEVIIQMLPDGSDIFDEDAGNVYTYELTVLQFVSGGSLNNLTLDGLADVDVSTPPTDGQVLAWDDTNSVYSPVDNAGGGATDLDSLSDVTIDSDTLDNSQFLRYNLTDTQWENVDVTIPNELDDLANVTNTTPTVGQVLTFNSDSVWAPADSAGGTNVDYNNAAYGSLQTPNVSYTYTTETSPVNEGEVSISTVDSPDTGIALLFRKADIDAKALQGIRYLQIGFGSPIAFATYAVSTTTITDVVDPQLVTITLIDGPLAGDDILATLPADDTALSINATSNEFENPDLGDLPDVSATAPTDNQVLTWNATNSEWEPQASQSGGATDLGGLNDVHLGTEDDGYVLRYVDANSRWESHSTIDTLRNYGGINVNRGGTQVSPVATGTDSLAVGNNSSATGMNDIAVGIDATASGNTSTAIGAAAEATAESSTAIGELSRSAHTNSTALGTGASTSENNEVRLGDGNAHVTVNSAVAGNESEENQLVSKRWVNNQIGDASRVISSTANAIENLTTTTASTPWGDYRIDVQNALNEQNLQVHMFEFDATESQFIFYPGFMSNTLTGTGADLSTGDLPDFFEEVTDIANESEVTNAGGDAVTSLGWKYLGHDTAVVWQAVSHVYTFDFEWIYQSDFTDGPQNPPDVTSSLELVRLKPLSDNTYSMNTNATVIASSPTQFHNAGQLNPGDTESFTGSYEFAQQLLSDGLSNVQNDDVFAYRMKVRYKGDGFDGTTNVRLAITESEDTNFVPQFGIRHVSRDFSLTVEDSGDVQWEDHNLTLDTLLLVDNSGDTPVIPTASLGLTAGNGITITGDDISVNANASDGLAVGSGGVAINPWPISGLALTASGVAVNPGPGLALNASSQVEVNVNPTNSSLTADANSLAVTVATNGGLSYDVPLVTYTYLQIH